MKITIINDSPKRKGSNSGLLIDYLIPMIEEQNDVSVEHIANSSLIEDTIHEILEADILVFAFPLYVDSIPAHLLYLMEVLTNRTFQKHLTVYVIINNGFFEGIQNRIAIEQMKIWCDKQKLQWGQGVGIGAGEMMPFIKDIPLGHGPNKNLGQALSKLADNINHGAGGEDIYLSPNWPKFMWKLQANQMFWIPRAKKYGLRKKDMYRKYN